MKIQNKNSWYTILVTLMIIGFLIVLTTWVLSLVLREMNDNKWVWMYLQAHGWAEWAMELALLKIKKEWYWVYDKKDNLDYLETQKSKIQISYDLNSKTKEYSDTLEPFEQSVIPLFYNSWSQFNNKKVNEILLNITSYWSNIDNSQMAWNIISENWDWIWWNNEILSNSKWNWKNNLWWFIGDININWNASEDFLNKYNNNYLVIVNLDIENTLEYKLTSTKEFTKPISQINSSAIIWNYKQNLETRLDNTAFLSILKYSIYSK